MCQVRNEKWKTHVFLYYIQSQGFILTCPSNLGTGLRAGAMVKLPLLYIMKIKVWREYRNSFPQFDDIGLVKFVELIYNLDGTIFHSSWWRN